MPDQPAIIPVESGVLRLMLAQSRAGISPRVPWSESRDTMVRAAMQARLDALEAINAELTRLLGLDKP